MPVIRRLNAAHEDARCAFGTGILMARNLALVLASDLLLTRVSKQRGVIPLRRDGGDLV
jgi:hypothetical protein